jgi:hypothetical protein
MTIRRTHALTDDGTGKVVARAWAGKARPETILKWMTPGKTGTHVHYSNEYGQNVQCLTLTPDGQVLEGYQWPRDADGKLLGKGSTNPATSWEPVKR